MATPLRNFGMTGNNFMPNVKNKEMATQMSEYAGSIKMVGRNM